MTGFSDSFKFTHITLRFISERIVFVFSESVFHLSNRLLIRSEKGPGSVFWIRRSLKEVLPQTVCLISRTWIQPHFDYYAQLCLPWFDTRILWGFTVLALKKHFKTQSILFIPPPSPWGLNFGTAGASPNARPFSAFLRITYFKLKCLSPRRRA